MNKKSIKNKLTKKNNMKPFNLEEALAGKHVVTRDERTVDNVFVCKNKAKKYPVIAIIEDAVYTHTLQGHFTSNDSESYFDLFMAEEETPLPQLEYAKIKDHIGNVYVLIPEHEFDHIRKFEKCSFSKRHSNPITYTRTQIRRRIIPRSK